ncbi:MAG TPA: hypothetical protein ENH84_00220 [Phycisphaerae bacterium]|nr:hypothetical protein [Phycisphaerae bacterium]
MAQLTPKAESPDVIRDPSGQLRYRTREEAGARRGVGQKLVKGLIQWARQSDWKRIVKRAHADLDCMYGEYGGGGKAFWEKAGFVVTSAHCKPWEHDDDWKSVVETEADSRDMTKEEAWTWYRMAYDL